MYKKNYIIGLSSLGLFCTMQASAFNVLELSKIPSNEINLSTKSMRSLVTGSEDLRTIEHKGEQSSLKSLSSKVDKMGKTHTRFKQTYNGIPVYGRQVIQHKPKSGSLFGFAAANQQAKFTGQLVSDIELDLAGVEPAPGFSADKALDLAKQIYNTKHNIKDVSRLVYENESSELFVYTHSPDGKAKLIYKVSFFIDDANGDMPARPTYLIDATSKQIIKDWNSLMNDRVATGPGGNEKIGKHYYGDDKPKLDVRETPRGECFFTNKKVRTVNLANGYWGAKTYHFPCYENLEKEINGAYSPLNDAQYYGEQVFNMFSDWYDKAPLKFKLIMRVHYGSNYENAFWNGSSMTFGDGHNYFYPLVSIDVVGHEVSHGYTEQNSDLDYMGQSGGINESFSDMAGKAVEYYTFGRNTWGIGDDITKGDEPLRYMDTPSKDGRSIDDARDFTSWIDVHYSSGVFNKAFFLLATSSGWNIKKAFDVFVHANTYYWVATSNYTDGALGAVYSAEDLGFNMNDVVEVYKKVGIECLEDSCSVMPPKEEPKDEPSDDDGSNTDGDSGDGTEPTPDDTGDSDDGDSLNTL